MEQRYNLLPITNITHENNDKMRMFYSAIKTKRREKYLPVVKKELSPGERQSKSIHWLHFVMDTAYSLIESK